MTEADYVLIDKKLSEELTLDEERSFKQRYAQSTAFAEEYRLQRQLVDTLRSQHNQQLKNEMKALHEEVKAERGKRRYHWPYAVAATIVLLLMVGTWFYQATYPSSSEDLFAAYYTPYRADPLVRSESESVSIYDRATQLYRTEQYRDVIPLLEHLLATDTTQRDKVLLLLGNSHLKDGMISSAIAYFRQATKSSNPIMQERATWYLALSYLRDENITAARPLLESIASHPGMYQAKAKALLEESPS
jgi:hypothetical protein